MSKFKHALRAAFEPLLFICFLMMASLALPFLVMAELAAPGTIARAFPPEPKAEDPQLADVPRRRRRSANLGRTSLNTRTPATEPATMSGGAQGLVQGDDKHEAPPLELLERPAPPELTYELDAHQRRTPPPTATMRQLSNLIPFGALNRPRADA